MDRDSKRLMTDVKIRTEILRPSVGWECADVRVRLLEFVQVNCWSSGVFARSVMGATNSMHTLGNYDKDLLVSLRLV